jgi:hypothetical protein
MYANKIIGKCVAAITSCLLLCGVAVAADDGTVVEPNANAGEKQDIPLVSGGVGEDEMNYIKSVERQYSLKLLFTEANGIFLSDLPVSINDKQGHTLVSTVTKGPILLVNLPPGTYNINVSDGGQNQQKKLSVPDHGQRVYQFRFAGTDQRSPEE